MAGLRLSARRTPHPWEFSNTLRALETGLCPSGPETQGLKSLLSPNLNSALD